MTPSEKHIRLEELSAGRAMGDLSMEEERELDLLATELGIEPELDIDFELLATALELESIGDHTEALPAGATARLEKWAEGLNATPEKNSPIVTLFRSPLTGWAVAAAITLIAVLIGIEDKPAPETVMTPTRLRSEAGDLLESRFQGIGDYGSAGGKVIWSDRLQQGYMILDGVPVNDPTTAQYQLWIVDPKRDEAPVDGGVFDIPAGDSSAVIPITAKLALSDPKAFVITLEQPGGVVKSKQEKVVAIAKG